jgi:hypothetical protein
VEQARLLGDEHRLVEDCHRSQAYRRGRAGHVEGVGRSGLRDRIVVGRDLASPNEVDASALTAERNRRRLDPGDSFRISPRVAIVADPVKLNLGQNEWKI